MLSLAMLGLGVPVRAQSLDREKAGVVRITASVDGKRKTGTGFIVRLEKDIAYILTASHVVEGDKQPEVEFFTRRNVQSRAETARIEGDDPRGLALLLVRGKDNLPAGLTVLPLAVGASLSGGEEITAIGFPQGGGPWAVVRANVVSRVGRDLTLGGSVDEGNSGGPILIDGSVVGVVVSVEGKFGRAVPAAIARLVLDGWGVPLEQSPGADRPAAQAGPTTGFRVLEVTPRAADPASLRGACPRKIDFSWKVSVAGGAGPVTYSVVRGDGVTGPTETISFAGPGSQEVRTAWTVGRADLSRNYTSWIALRILSPQKLESEKTNFSADCQGAPAAPSPQESSVKILHAACEKLRTGTTYRIVLDGEGHGPAGAILRAALMHDGKLLATPAASCVDWKRCQREPTDPDKTHWKLSTMFLGSAPTEAIISLDPGSKAEQDPSYAVDRVSLKCSSF
jgi:hypothetical protein